MILMGNVLRTEEHIVTLIIKFHNSSLTLQEKNLMKILYLLKNMYINNTRNLTGEAEQCMKLLNITGTTENESLFNVRKLRTQLTREEYDH